MLYVSDCYYRLPCANVCFLLFANVVILLQVVFLNSVFSLASSVVLGLP